MCHGDLTIWRCLDAAGAGKVLDGVVKKFLVVLRDISGLHRHAGDELFHGIRSVAFLPREVALEARLVGKIFVDFGIFENVRSPVACIGSVCRS